MMELYTSPTCSSFVPISTRCSCTGDENLIPLRRQISPTFNLVFLREPHPSLFLGFASSAPYFLHTLFKFFSRLCFCWVDRRALDLRARLLSFFSLLHDAPHGTSSFSSGISV